MQLKTKLSELHRLHLATIRLEHGVNNKESWILFEPTKFIYAYFTFNSTYTIDWQDAFHKDKVVECSYGKTERDKIYELIDFYFYKLGNNAVVEYCKIMKYHIGRLDPLAELKHTRPDILENFKLLYEEKYSDNIVANMKVLKDSLACIYKVRNNIFHGSKNVTQMMDSEQQNRLSIYTSMLIAANELLFLIAKKEIFFKS